MASSLKQVAWKSALLCSFFSATEAAILAAPLLDAAKATLFYNRKSGKPGADQSVPELKWEIQNQSYIDEDTDYSFIEITNTLTMPVLSTDTITFHVEFTSSK